MSTSGVFDTTVHKTNEWLGDIMRRLGWSDPHRAWAALRAVLHVLRDRLGVQEAVALGAQLPLLVRGAYYEGWVPSREPVRIRHESQLVERVAAEMRGYRDVIDPAEVTRAVLDVLSEHVSSGAIDHVVRVMPRDLRRLFPEQHASP